MVESWDEFKKIHAQFSLGHLDTETPNPMTSGLAELAHKDASAAWNMLRNVDLKMLTDLKQWAPQVSKLGKEVSDTLKAGGRVYLSGCGATGRLSLSLEALWRFEKNTEQVVAFMAGGDTALIRAIERFEDYPELGERQLRELGFTSKDLLIASTEGGETPFVIGSAMTAVEMGGKAWLTFCNPPEQLERLDRCRTILNDKRVTKLALTLGPQALSGSTRMQASTSLMLVAGLALWFGESAGEELIKCCDQLTHDLKAISTSDWANLSQAEAQYINDGKCVSYIAPANYSICLLTDTTERGPTFSMTPFEHINDPSDKPSYNYMAVETAKDAADAFIKILGHTPRTLDWPELGGRADEARLNGFILTPEHLSKRAIESKRAIFNIGDNGFALELEGLIASAEASQSNLLYRHLLLKMLLNTHSTLLMGLLGRYQSNVMTWVRASNLKLIDRTLRYATLLLNERKIKVDQNTLGAELFRILPTARLDEPLVVKLVNSFSQM